MKTVVILSAEYSNCYPGSEDFIAVFDDFDETEKHLPDFLNDGYLEEGDFKCYFACEFEVGVTHQNEYLYRRYDKEGHIIDDWSKFELEGKR